MQHTPCNILRACAAGALVALLPAAWAAPAGQADTPASQVQAVVPKEAPARARPDFGPPVELGKLEQARGGADTHNTMQLDGIVSGNTAVNVQTGSNAIDTGAFANMAGIPVVIQNTGANVLIQNATIVNLQFK